MAKIGNVECVRVKALVPCRTIEGGKRVTKSIGATFELEKNAAEEAASKGVVKILGPAKKPTESKQAKKAKQPNEE